MFVLAGALLCALGCEEFDYQGFQKPFRFNVFQDVPLVHISVDGAPPMEAIVDTGAPVTTARLTGDGSQAKRTVRLLEHLECVGDSQCTDARWPRCEEGECVAAARRCRADTDCATPERAVCFRGVCVSTAPGCSNDAQCGSDGQRVCSSGRCVLLNPRFVFSYLNMLDMPVNPLGLTAGNGSTTTYTVGAVLGASLLAHFTVRLLYRESGSQMTLLDEIPDSLEQLSDDCDHGALVQAVDRRCAGVFRTPLRGGGLLSVGGEIHELAATRLVVPLCLMPDAFDRTKINPSLPAAEQPHGAAKDSGVAATGVLVTGLGTTLISATLAAQLRSLLPTSTVESKGKLALPHSPTPIDVTLLTIPRWAVVSNETRERDPCGELGLRRRLLAAAQVPLNVTDSELVDGKSINGASAAALSESVQVAVIPDENDFLQGLRKELRPASADIDVVLGGSFLKAFELEIDYPASRIILRCSEDTTTEQCDVLPFCAHFENSDQRAIWCPTTQK